MKNYDAVIIGAGSVGLPLAHSLGAKGLKVAVLDKKASPGQGQNKAAIGGIRATHSDRAKIRIGNASLDFIRRLKLEFGQDVDYVEGGYLFPAYDPKIANSLKGLLPIQKDFGLNIDWIEPEEVRARLPGIKADGLLGGTFSPNDGHLCSLKLAGAFYRLALAEGVDFFFNTEVKALEEKSATTLKITTSGKTFSAAHVINAAGGAGRDIAALVGTDLPVYPDSHEAGVTEPVQPFILPMIVDIAPDENSDNYYFYQNLAGNVVFCITPRPQRWGTDRRSTSEFLPMVIPRMLN